MEHFYPRSPCGERLSCAWSASKLGDFYPRSPCGERLRAAKDHDAVRVISIHALLAESDKIPPHCFLTIKIFLSTLSLRRATSMRISLFCGCSDFYPRSPCGERHNINSSVNTADKISIHALLAESDLNCSRNGFAIL